MARTPEDELNEGAQGPVLVVEPAEAGMRADRFLQRRLPGLGRREAARWIAAGGLLWERPCGLPRPVSKGLVLAAGDRLRLGPGLLAIEAGDARASTGAPLVPALAPGVLILHEDAHLVALGKPAGLPTHPLRPGETGTLANHLAALFEIPRDLGGPAREAGLVHRLDTLTSGLMVAARTAEAYASLRSQFREHLVEKAYLALVTGAPPDDLVVDAPIESRRGRRKVTLGRGQPAETGVTVLTRFTGLALVEARTRHGRRHQVRAHLAQAGHPLLGDPLYGPPVLAAAVPPAGPSERDSASPECVPNSPGALPLPEGPWPLLHASYLRFAHPADGRPFELRLSLPEEAEEALRKLPLA